MQSALQQFGYPARGRGWLAAATLSAFIIVALGMLALTGFRGSWAWPAHPEFRFQTSPPPLGGLGTVPLPPSL